MVRESRRKIGSWYAAVLEIETGEERGRAETGRLRSGGMWDMPGFGRH
jgi:hypothetical protein